MARDETLVERLIPGDLEHRIPAAVEKVLPGGFRNRLVQVALGAMIAFGLSFIVRRWIERREAKRPAFAPAPTPAPLVFSEPEPRRAVAQPMTDPAPSPPSPAAPPAGRARDYPLLATPHVHLSGPVDQAM